MFRLLRLSPPHGWRSVAWELGIVTLGVLIALGAQQLVERSSSKARAIGAQLRIKNEIDFIQSNEVERVAIRTCLTDRLRDLANGLVNRRVHWIPLRGVQTLGSTEPALGSMYRVPSRVWVTDAYDEALAQGDLKNLSLDQRAGLVPLYAQIKYMSELNVEEQRLTTELAPLQFDPALSDAEKNSLIAIIARLDQINRLIVLISRQTFDKYRNLGYIDPPEAIAQFHRSKSWENLLAGYRDRFGPCVDARAVGEINPALLPATMR